MLVAYFADKPPLYHILYTTINKYKSIIMGQDRESSKHMHTRYKQNVIVPIL